LIDGPATVGFGIRSESCGERGRAILGNDIVCEGFPRDQAVDGVVVWGRRCVFIMLRPSASGPGTWEVRIELKSPCGTRGGNRDVAYYDGGSRGAFEIELEEVRLWPCRFWESRWATDAEAVVVAAGLGADVVSEPLVVKG